MCPPGFLELGSNLERRIQRRQGTLQHQRDRASAQRAQFAFRELQEIGLLKPDCAFGWRPLLIEKTENRHGQRALARAALSDQTQHFAALDFQLHVAQNRRLARIAHREVRRQQNRVLRDDACFLLLPATVSHSAFQKVCGGRITGAAPCTDVETAESEFLLIRKINGSSSTTISCTRSKASFRFFASLEDACARMSLSISASQGVAGCFWLGFHW